MHISFVEYLVDPETKESLELEVTESKGDLVESGFLKSGANKYPIVRGIPRFVEFKSKNYSKSFGYQWHKWPRVQFESDNIGKPMEGHTRRMWEIIIGVNENEISLENQTIVDIGCGPGRFIDVARFKGARVIGIDYSNAVEVAKDNFKNDPNVCICQADALNLPLKSNSIDGAFTIGVLHHTPNPEKGLNQAWSSLRNGGWFAISVYEKGRYYDYSTVQLWRKIFKALWPVLGHYPPLVYTYFTIYAFGPLVNLIPSLERVIRVFFPFVKLPDLNWSLLDTFDSVTPSYQSAHESYEVFSWLKKASFTNIEPTNWGSTSYRGVKGNR
jgi:SAM-dependent methyltransferase